MAFPGHPHTFPHAPCLVQFLKEVGVNIGLGTSKIYWEKACEKKITKKHVCGKAFSLFSKSELYGRTERKGKLRGKHLKSIFQFWESSKFLLPLAHTLAALWWLSW